MFSRLSGVFYFGLMSVEHVYCAKQKPPEWIFIVQLQGAIQMRMEDKSFITEKLNMVFEL